MALKPQHFEGHPELFNESEGIDGLHVGSWPDTVPAKVKDFVENYYDTSKGSRNHHQYLEFWAPDAEYIHVNSKATGHKDIIALRKGMRSHSESFKMSPLEAFTASSDGMELVLLGTIETAHHTTPDQPKEDQFVFRMSLTQIGGKLKIKRYESML
ncbi:hypothetical protein MMC12_007871, partial [Toensbergia leucococca]|nr:hypothetical protein [Toensbergia leucococca]